MEVKEKAIKVLESKQYRDKLVKCSDCPIEQVRVALDFEAPVRDQIFALNEIYNGLVQKLPARQYKLVKTQDDIRGYDDSADFRSWLSI